MPKQGTYGLHSARERNTNYDKGGWNVPTTLEKSRFKNLVDVCDICDDGEAQLIFEVPDPGQPKRVFHLCVHHTRVWDAGGAEALDQHWRDRNTPNATCAECEKRFYGEDYLCKYCRAH